MSSVPVYPSGMFCVGNFATSLSTVTLTGDSGIRFISAVSTSASNISILVDSVAVATYKWSVPNDYRVVGAYKDECILLTPTTESLTAPSSGSVHYFPPMIPDGKRITASVDTGYISLVVSGVKY